ncbi:MULTISPECIES: hypothetical protein [Streptomycetaceae]|uniref:Integral membrane protein n=1 Tax=Streptantibioticus cattleyicolor (strain ATCC 35852 / DSM 46488 / JCM 4925 / NBRC 14057 / NRRL 8057) TaxID=1003195 RepID=F8K4N5_STREN|nr:MULTISPECIES: hypothetical protein [Streptomycetaceae]AEW96391.1 integral membrane protein [Streptantibioticus cattleyicolor NRRL 8057 = DSM 46488]MYS60903.1 hypothetical protein [Streptomyces sp. SID5468]CCB76730.1 putative membrane protein [Streptantibioticus cattleyicolor NRRL 8057 = DSM 46488]
MSDHTEDLVQAVLERHRELCVRATHPVQIAAALEAHGVTDRVAVLFHHRDVFSLAEELYARVARPPAPVPSAARTAVLHLLPGAACAAGVVAVRLAGPDPWRAAACAALALVAVAATTRAAVREGPLRGPAVPGGALTALWLLAFALFGGEVLGGAGIGTPDTGVDAGVLGPAFAVLPAAWCARRFAARERVRLAPALAAFATVVAALCAAAYLVLALAGADGRPDPVRAGGTAALGVLLFAARLLATRGLTAAAAAGCAAACAVEAAALAVTAWSGPAVRPLDALVRAGGPGAVEAVACAVALAALTGYALPVLARTATTSQQH